MRTNKIFIGGKWVNSSSGKTFESFNPANGRSLGKFPQGNKSDVDNAVRAAWKAYPGWSQTPAPERAEILFTVRDLLKQNKKELAKCITMEMGKVLAESEGDVQEAIDVFEYMAGEGRRLFGHTTPSELPDKFCMTLRVPVGVFGVITPWNFPFALPAWKIAPALICGNTVVFKPSSDTPLCGIRFVELLVKAGVPAGVVNLVTGSGKDVGTPIIRHENIRGISFTGSRNTGKFIAENAGLKKVGLELGGKNGIIVMDDADLDLAVDGAVWGGFGTTGQRCTAASRVIVHKKVQKDFEKKFIARIKKLRLGSGLDSKVDVGPLVNESAVEKVQKYVGIGKKEGAGLLCGGKKLKGLFFEPTVFSDAKKGMTVAQEEIFGPVVTIIPVKNFREAIDVINSVDYGLSSSIFTRSIDNAFKAIQKIEAGITYINSSTTGAEVHLPFGGVKQTGNGTREAGMEGIDEFSETKTVYVDYSGRLQKAQDIEWGEK
ncbi:aldehyde dehydrogenase family protein [Candidatus Woesearchaeota archaeon]|nr:aldehyde dehydrogenase family protein [Candidatus Woesearchaeota archaeon]